MTTQQSELLRGFIQSSFRSSTRWTWIKSLWMQWAMSRVKYKQYEAVLWCSYLFIYHMMFFHCKHTFCKGSPSSFGPRHVDVSPCFMKTSRFGTIHCHGNRQIILLKHQEIEVELPLHCLFIFKTNFVPKCWTPLCDLLHQQCATGLVPSTEILSENATHRNYIEYIGILP